MNKTVFLNDSGGKSVFFNKKSIGIVMSSPAELMWPEHTYSWKYFTLADGVWCECKCDLVCPVHIDGKWTDLSSNESYNSDSNRGHTHTIPLTHTFNNKFALSKALYIC